MASLVADYSSSASETENNQDSENESEIPFDEEKLKDSGQSEEEIENETLGKSEKMSQKLPRPNFESSGVGSCSLNVKNSVFSNPFVEAENAKKAILEKHVKMTPTKDEIKMINGKKICWNFRKGRCRFGHNCKFAHDSDLQKSEESSNELDKTTSVEPNQQQQTAAAAAVHLTSKPVLLSNSHRKESLDDNPNEQETERKKKRQGLTQGLVPGKKVMKMYKKQQVKDTPWTISSKTSI